MQKRISPVSAMEFSSRASAGSSTTSPAGSSTTSTSRSVAAPGLEPLAEHSAEGSADASSEPASPHSLSLAASNDTEGGGGAQGSYDMAGRDSSDRSSTTSTISISVSDMQRVSTSSTHGSIVEAPSNKQLAVEELESPDAGGDGQELRLLRPATPAEMTGRSAPKVDPACPVSYTCPILAFQQRIFDLFRVTLRLPEGSTETREKLLEGANVAKVAAVENIATIRRLHNLTKDIQSGIADLVLAAEVEEPGLAHDVLDQHRRMIEDLQDQRRVVHEMNFKLATIVHSIVAASATDPTVDTAVGTGAGDIQLDVDLAILVKDVKSLKSPRRATLSPEGILMPPSPMPALEKAESVERPSSATDAGAKGQGAGAGAGAGSGADNGQVVPAQQAGGGGGDGDGASGSSGGGGGGSGSGELSTGVGVARLVRMMDEIDNHLALIDSHHTKFEQGFDKMAKSGDGLKRLVDYTGKVKVMDRYQVRSRRVGFGYGGGRWEVGGRK